MTIYISINITQPNDTLYISTCSLFPYLYDDERPDERTNNYIAQNHNPYTTIHPSTMLFLLSLCHWPIPILSFCSIPFTNFIFLWQRAHQIYILMLCLSCCLINGDYKLITLHLHDMMIALYKMKKKTLQKNKGDRDATIGVASHDACVPHKWWCCSFPWE